MSQGEESGGYGPDVVYCFGGTHKPVSYRQKHRPGQGPDPSIPIIRADREFATKAFAGGTDGRRSESG